MKTLLPLLVATLGFAATLAWAQPRSAAPVASAAASAVTATPSAKVLPPVLCACVPSANRA